MFEDLYPNPEPTPVPEQGGGTLGAKVPRPKMRQGQTSTGPQPGPTGPPGATYNYGAIPTPKKINLIQALSHTVEEIALYAYALKYYKAFELLLCAQGLVTQSTVTSATLLTDEQLLDALISETGISLLPSEKIDVLLTFARI